MMPLVLLEHFFGRSWKSKNPVQRDAASRAVFYLLEYINQPRRIGNVNKKLLLISLENTSSPEECFSHPASGMPVLQILSLWRSKVSLFLCRAAGPSLNNYIPRPYSPCNEVQCCWWCALNGTYSRVSMCRQTRRLALLYWPAHSSTPPQPLCSSGAFTMNIDLEN